jgi:hypothetical protein
MLDPTRTRLTIVSLVAALAPLAAAAPAGATFPGAEGGDVGDSDRRHA